MGIAAVGSVIVAFEESSSTVNKGISWIGMVMLLTVIFIECGIVDMVFVLTLILASISEEKFSVFLSTFISPPQRLAFDSNVLVFNESKGRPRMRIQPLNWVLLLSIAFVSR